MYKALCAAALLVGLLALTGRSSSAAPAPFSSPLVVAKGKLVNQTGPISSAAIFTPPQGGVYRLAVYMTQTVPVTTSGANWNLNVAWSDDAGSELANGVLFLPVNQLPPSAYGNLVGGSPGNNLVLQ